jgi:hypothetical protein
LTTEKRIGVWNCYASCRHRKTTTFTSLFFGRNTAFLFIFFCNAPTVLYST